MSRPTRPPTYLCWCPARPDGYGSSTCGGATPAKAAETYVKLTDAYTDRPDCASGYHEVIHVRDSAGDVTVVRVTGQTRRVYSSVVLEGGGR